MLQRLNDLPPGIEGICATGQVSREDYDTVVEPLLQSAEREGRKIRFLYEFGAGFDGFTPGAAWEDAKLSLQYLSFIEACAVLTDTLWIRETSRAIAFVLPCPVRIFSTQDRDEAIRWLVTVRDESTEAHRLIRSRGVIVLEVQRALRAQDFDALSATADAWIEEHGHLHGLVVHAREFPGWENFPSFLSHIRFVRDHHRRIQRVALAADTPLASVAPHIAQHFLAAEVKHFEYDALERAIEWAGEDAPPARAAGGR